MTNEVSSPKDRQKRSVNMRDVAVDAGVDPSVVSRVISGDPRLSIRPETRQRVLASITRLNYTPHVGARGLRTSRTMAVAFAVPELENTAFASAVRGAEDEAWTEGYVVMVLSGFQLERLEQLVGRVDGLLIASATSESRIPRRLIERLPMMLVNRREPGEVPGVVVDDRLGVRIGVGHLASLGHRRIALVVHSLATDTARRRLEGYVESVEEFDLERRSEWVIETSWTEAGGADAARRLLLSENPPSAIFVSNNRAAIGILSAARKLRLEVPRDVSIVGMDDIPAARFLDPPLTTVALPMEEMGRLAIRSLFALIAGETVRDSVVPSPPELVVRSSSCPPRSVRETV